MSAELGRLKECTRGNVSIFFAIAAVPMFLAVGAATEFARWLDARSELTAALDGAALAAAQKGLVDDDQRAEIGEAFFASNFKYSGVLNPIAQVTVQNGDIHVSADLALPTTIMRLAGIQNMELSAEAEANIPVAGNAELVLVLDYSGSMNSNNKYSRMAEAAVDMLDSLESAADDVDFTVGLVPFSAMVRTSMPAAYVNQSASGAIWTGCTQDRSYPYNTGVSTPTADTASKWGYIDGSGENNGGYGCNAYANKDLTIQPLTSDLDDVREQLDDMRPLGNTNIALGAEFGWNLLDPALPYDQAKAYDDPNNKKFLVLLTDGVQTSREFGENNGRSVPNAQGNLTALCNGMRAQGITVFTIAYDVTNPAVTTLLQNCAPGRYYEPSVGGDDLQAVFSEITAQITDEVVRLTK
jgi:Flp pilus assembly protein TadG